MLNYILNKLRYIRAHATFLVDKSLARDFVAYHFFPFDVLRPLGPSASDVMNEGCNILKSVSAAYRLTDGTVLGLVREGNFISHDNDIDVDVLVDSHQTIINIEAAFKDKGYILGRKVFYLNRVQQLIFYNKDKIIFDIIFWYPQLCNTLTNHSEKGFIRKQDSIYFENLDFIEFKGVAYPVPARVVDWLVMRYGDDWEIPKTFKGDWKKECMDMLEI